MPILRPESDTSVPLFLSLRLNLSLRSPFPGPTFLPSCPFFLLLHFLLLCSDLEEDLCWAGWHPKRDIKDNSSAEHPSAGDTVSQDRAS